MRTHTCMQIEPKKRMVPGGWCDGRRRRDGKASKGLVVSNSKTIIRLSLVTRWTVGTIVAWVFIGTVGAVIARTKGAIVGRRGTVATKLHGRAIVSMQTDEQRRTWRAIVTSNGIDTQFSRKRAIVD